MTHEKSPFGSAGAVAGRAPQAPASNSAFNRVFNPELSGIPAMIGSLIGARAPADQALGARSSGLAELAHQLIADASGLNTQRIVLDHLASSAGMEGVQNDPKYLSKVKALAEGSALSPSAKARSQFAAQADVPVEEVADLELLKMEQDLLTLTERELIFRADTLGVTPKSILALEQALRQAELDDKTGSQREFAALAEQSGMTPEELGKFNLARKQAELTKLERQNKMTEAARQRQEIEAETGEAPGTVAALEIAKARGELVTAEGRARNERAELLGVDPAVLAQVEQSLAELELSGTAQRDRAALAKVLGITPKELAEVDLNRKRAELEKVRRQNRLSDAARDRADREKEAGIPPGTIAATDFEINLLSPAVREALQFAELGGSSEVEKQELLKRFAVAKLVVESEGRTQEERAFLGLIEKGLITKTEALLRLSGVMQIIPVMNAVGEPTGEYDLVNTLPGGTTRRVTATSAADRAALDGMVGGGAPTGATGAPAVAAVPEAAPGEPGAAPESRVPAGIINQSGVVPIALGLFYGFVNQVFTPDEQTAIRKQQQNTLETIGNRFRDYVTGEGRMLKIEAGTLAPIVDNIKLGKSPDQVGGSLLAMHDTIDADEAIAVKLLEGPKQELLTDTQRERLSKARVDALVMRAQLPTREALEFELEAGRTRNPLEAAKEELERAESALGGGTPELDPGAVVPPAAALTTPPGGGPPIEVATDADSVVPPAGAVDPEALPEEDGPSFFDDMNLRQFVPPALRVRITEMEAVIEVVRTTTEPVTDIVGPPVHAILEQITNVGVGFNTSLAQFIGIAPEMLNEAIVLLGNEGFLDEPGDAVEEMMSAFEAVGFVPAPGSASLDSFSAGLGREVFNATVGAAVFLVAAPVLAAAEGVPILQWVGKQGTQFAQDYPLLFGLTTAGGAVGPDVLEAIVGSEDMDPALRELVRTIGAFGGAIVLGAPAAGARRLLRPRILKKPFMKKPPSDTEGAMNVSALRAFAREQVDADIKMTNNSIRKVIEDFAPGVLGKGGGASRFSSPQKAVAALRTALRAVEKGPARLLERQKWAAIDGDRDMTPGLSKIITWARKQVTNTGADTLTDEIPKGALKKILAWQLSPKGETDRGLNALLRLGAVKGPKKYKSRGINDLLKLRTTWLAKIRDPATSTQHRAFYKKAQKRLLTEIERQWPNDVRVQEALAYSNWLNARFNSPALSGFLLKQSGGDFDPEKAIGTLVRLVRVDKGAPSVTVISDIAAKLDRPGLMETARGFIRKQFGDIAKTLDDQAAQSAGPGLSAGETTALGRKAGAIGGRAFLNGKTTKAFAAAFPEVKVDADFAIENLSKALRAQTAVQETAFAAFAGNNTRDAVKGLMTSPNRVAMVRELVSRMPKSAAGENPNSLDALRNGMVDWLFSTTNVAEVKPSTIIAALNQPGIRQTFRMVYSPSEMRRLDRLLASAMAVQQGQISWVAKVFDNTIGKTFRIAGAFFGAKVIKSGTVQIPGMFAQMSGDIASKLTSFGSPSRMLALAMVDSRMERILLSRIPKNLTEVRKLTDLMRLISTGIVDATRLPVREREGVVVPPAEEPE